MEFFKASAVNLITLLGIAAAGYLSFREKLLTAYPVGIGALLVASLLSININNTALWRFWMLRFWVAMFAIMSVVAALSKGMGTGSESGDRISRNVFRALSVVFVVTFIILDVVAYQRGRQKRCEPAG